ncbi:MAG TPA: hypothetical protein VIF62_21255 [Labilithrix sp.]|jgi:hypothetical protein
MRSRRSLVLVSAVGFVGAAWACSTFSSSDSNAAADDSGADQLAPPPPPQPAPPASGDDGAPADAGDADCSWFCDDFEADAWPEGSGWSAPDTYQNGSIALTTTEWVSPTHSLLATLPLDSGFTASGRYARTIENVKSFHCELSVRVDAQGSDYGSLVQANVQTTSGAVHTLTYADNGNKNWVEFVEDTAITQLPSIDLGEWVRVGIDYELGKPTRLTYGGAVVNAATPSPAADAGAETLALVTLHVGATRNAATGVDSWSAAFDDVSCIVTK